MHLLPQYHGSVTDAVKAVPLVKRWNSLVDLFEKQPDSEILPTAFKNGGGLIARMTTSTLSTLFKCIKEQQHCNATIQPFQDEMREARRDLRCQGDNINAALQGNTEFPALPAQERCAPTNYIDVSEDGTVTTPSIVSKTVIHPPATLCGTSISVSGFEQATTSNTAHFRKEASAISGSTAESTPKPVFCKICGLDMTSSNTPWKHQRGQMFNAVGGNVTSAALTSAAPKITGTLRTCPVPGTVQESWASVLEEKDTLYFRVRSDRPKAKRLREHPFVELYHALTTGVSTDKLHTTCVICGRRQTLVSITPPTEEATIASNFRLMYAGYCSQGCRDDATN